MSTDSSLPESGDTGITGRTSDAPAEPEPFLAQSADDDVLDAELADGDEPPRPRRRRVARPPLPPGPPHPGFWWALGWCLLLLFVCELIVPLGVGLAIFIVQAIRLGGLDPALHWLTDNQYEPALLLPLQMSGHVAIFIMALLALRLVVGKSWPRQIAVRLPAVGHVLLAAAGAPAFWLLGNGLQFIASQVLPTFYELPCLLIVAALLMMLVGACWLVVRVTMGVDWVRALAASPLRIQLIVGPLGVLVLLVLAALIYRLVNPYIARIPEIKEDLFQKGIESLMQVPWWAALLVIAVTPAFSEEFWCRAFLGRGLVGRHGYVMGIIWTSLFFGTIHIFPHQAAMAAILGIVLHSAYIASRSLLIPMLMHYLNNSLAVLTYKFLGNLSPRLQIIETAPQQVPWVWFLAAGFLGAAVLWAFYTSRARLVRTDGSDEPAWKPLFAGVAHPPPGSGTEVVYPWPSVLPTLAVIAGIAGLGWLYWA